MNLEAEIQWLRRSLSRQKPYTDKWHETNRRLAERVRKWRETNTLRSVS